MVVVYVKFLDLLTLFEADRVSADPATTFLVREHL
jgi:hypothetical protein